MIDPAAADPAAAAADLIDVLEAFAFDSEAGAIRLDGTAFHFAAPLRLADRGYEVGPPYDGDTDVEVWSGRRLVD